MAELEVLEGWESLDSNQNPSVGKWDGYFMKKPALC